MSEIVRSDAMEERLRKILLDCKTDQEFINSLLDFCLSIADENWIDITKVFSDKQEKWREKLIDKLKYFIDIDLVRPTRDITFNSDYTKFEVSNIEGF
jgi:hypothetical protein